MAETWNSLGFGISQIVRTFSRNQCCSAVGVGRQEATDHFTRHWEQTLITQVSILSQIDDVAATKSKNKEIMK